MGVLWTRRDRGRDGVLALAIWLLGACGGASGEGPATSARPERAASPPSTDTAGAEAVPPPPPADLANAAPRPPEPPPPADSTALEARLAPRRLFLPTTRSGATSRFTFDGGQRRGWYARLPAGRQRLLTPLYGRGQVFVGGGFSSHALFAYDARTGERSWTASAPDGGPSAAILEDDKVLFNTESCTLFAVDARTGRRRWARWLGDPLMSQPAARNGLVFSGHVVDGRSPGGIRPGTTGYGVGQGRRYGFTALSLDNGAPRWTRPIRADVMNAPVLDADSVYFTTMEGTVQRLDQRTGRVRWRRSLRATSAPWLDGAELHLSVRVDGERQEQPVVLDTVTGRTLRTLEGVDAAFLRGRPDAGGVQAGWAYEGSRPTTVDGRMYQTIGNEVHCRDAATGRLLWRRRYAEDVGHHRPATPPAVAGGQLVFGTADGELFGLDIDTGLTTWAYQVGEPIQAQPIVAHGWVYAATARGGLVALEVSDRHLDGWHMWGGNASHTGPVAGDRPPEEEDDRPSEGTLRLASAPREGDVPTFLVTGTRVRAQVSGFVARVEVEQSFQNPYARAVDGEYLFPLPDDAAVDAMELRAGDRVVRAVIHRRQEARERYAAARDQGFLASLLEQERPNLFRQTIANLAPGEEIRVALSYTQVLPYEAGSYRFVYPMVAGPRYAPQREEGSGDGPVRQVVLPPGAERPDRVEVHVEADLGLTLQGVTSPTHELAVERPAPERADVRLTGAAAPDRDLDVRFQVAGTAPTVGVLAHAPEENAPGHVALSIHPRLDVPDGEVTPRELVFVLDTSSSMHGRPLALAKAAVRRALAGLRPHDTFRVLTFNDRASALSQEALPATSAHVERAIQYVEGLRALGTTAMEPGLVAALSPPAEAGRLRYVLLLTDGYLAEEAAVFRTVNAQLGQARVFAFGVGSAVNRYLLTRVAEVGRGDVQVVTLDESPEAAADAFQARIARPFVTDLQIDWGGLPVADAYPRRLPDLYADRPLVVHARYRAGGAGTVTLRGRVAGRPFAQEVSVRLPQGDADRPELASLWARTRIRDLMLAMALQPNDALREEVTQLGLAHHLLTEWTAFLAVDWQRRVARDPETPTARQPAQAPAGVTPPAPTAAPPPRMARPAPRLGAVRGQGAGSGSLGGVRRPASEARRSRRPVRRRPAPADAAPAHDGDDDGRREDCLARARRPDGSIDQAALEECLRRQGARQKGEARPRRAATRLGRRWAWRREGRGPADL